MIALEEGAELSHLNEIRLFFLNLSFKTQAILERAEFLDKLYSFLIIFFDAGRNLSFF